MDKCISKSLDVEFTECISDEELNRNCGGHGYIPMSSAARAEHSQRMSGTGNPMHGKKHSEEARAKMRAAHTKRKKNGN